MSTTEERSAKIIAQADAMVKRAQASIDKTQAFLSETGGDRTIEYLNVKLNSEVTSEGDRNTIKHLARTLAAVDMGKPPPAAPAAKPKKKPRAMI